MSHEPSTQAGDAIDAYLDELARRLRVQPDRVRRILAESEDHLREAGQGVARGDERERLGDDLRSHRMAEQVNAVGGRCGRVPAEHAQEMEPRVARRLLVAHVARHRPRGGPGEELPVWVPIHAASKSR